MEEIFQILLTQNVCSSLHHTHHRVIHVSDPSFSLSLSVTFPLFDILNVFITNARMQIRIYTPCLSLSLSLYLTHLQPHTLIWVDHGAL